MNKYSAIIRKLGAILQTKKATTKEVEKWFEVFWEFLKRNSLWVYLFLFLIMVLPPLVRLFV